MYSTIQQCRICGNTNLVSLINVGEQALTGVFPKSTSEQVSIGPLELVKCHPLKDDKVCNLVQLRHFYNLSEMYGLNYGYRSGLNQSMVKHLRQIVDYILSNTTLNSGDLVIDIGSNDSTLLQNYPLDCQLIGIDPTGVKFAKYYPAHIQLIPDFFSPQLAETKLLGLKAKVITSIAMFYDLENPVSFAKAIATVLDEKGVWVFEQSYLPAMLETNSYDTICHEHLEYYSLAQIEWILEQAGLKILDVSLNDVNGGSFCITAGHPHHEGWGKDSHIVALQAQEKQLHLDRLDAYIPFKNAIDTHKEALLDLLRQLKQEGKTVLGYGASTKGNVVLQYCQLTAQDIPCIAEVNEDKFGAFTPLTHIPIVSEAEAKALKPDYFLVLPWHFRASILAREQEFLNQGGKFIFPLPHIEIVGL